MKWLLYISFSLLLTVTPSNSFAGDNDNLQLRKFNEDQLEMLRDAYDYYDNRPDKKKKDKQSSSNSSGTRTTRGSTGSGSGGSSRNSGGSGSGDSSPLLYVVFGIAIIGLVVLMLTSQGGLTFVRKNKPREEVTDGIDIIEDIHKMDILSILDKAINNGEYRRATRLMYLDILKKLSLKKMIDWEENKTNRDYLYEIKDRKIRKGYEEATVMYEYVWYGDIDVNKESFDLVQQKFNKVMKQIG